MGNEEKEQLKKALRELTEENSSKPQATALFMEDGYFDQTGKLAREYQDEA